MRNGRCLFMFFPVRKRVSLTTIHQPAILANTTVIIMEWFIIKGLASADSPR